MKEQDDWDEVVRIKGQLNEMLQEDLMGLKVRSKHKQDLEVERASLFHAAREHKNFKNVPSGLKIDNKIVIGRFLTVLCQFSLKNVVSTLCVRRIDTFF